MERQKKNNFLKHTKSRDERARITERKTKIRSGSVATIFGMPISTLSFYQPSEGMNILKNQKSHLKIAEDSIELGTIGLEYNINLRKTIMNQTKQLYHPLKKQRPVLDQDNYMFEDSLQEGRSKRRPAKIVLSNSENTNYNRINIVQRSIIKVDKDKKQIFQLQAFQLPIIKKKQSKRKQSLAAFQVKYLPHQDTQMAPKIGTLLQLRRKEERPNQISGWDSPDVVEYQ